MSVWLLLTFSMKTPPAVRTKMYHLEATTEAQASELGKVISALPYVHEAVAIAKENMLIVKIKNQALNKQQANEQEILDIVMSK